MNPLREPCKHPLYLLFEELKWGRPAKDQQFLLWLSKKVKDGAIGNLSLEDIANDLEKEMEDPANWWKQE